MSFKQNATKKNGEPNQPIRVVDIKGDVWPEDVLIGNGTVADVKFVVIDNGKGRFNGVYPRSIRILDLEPFAQKEFDDIDEDDEYYKKAQQAENDIALLAGNKRGSSIEVDNDDDLDDDLDEVFGEA